MTSTTSRQPAPECTSAHPHQEKAEEPRGGRKPEEGLDLGLAVRCWRKLAANECRLFLLGELGKCSVGYAEVEEYSLDLNLKLKSKEIR